MRWNLEETRDVEDRLRIDQRKFLRRRQRAVRCGSGTLDWQANLFIFQLFTYLYSREIGTSRPALIPFSCPSDARTSIRARERTD